MAIGFTLAPAKVYGKIAEISAENCPFCPPIADGKRGLETADLPMSIDYVTYILSSISFWFGFSPLGLLHFIRSTRYFKLLFGNSNVQVNDITGISRTSSSSQNGVRNLELQMKTANEKINLQREKILVLRRRVELLENK